MDFNNWYSSDMNGSVDFNNCTPLAWSGHHMDFNNGYSSDMNGSVLRLVDPVSVNT